MKFLDYPNLIKSNLLNVIKYALKKTSEYGLSDEHHFYITFKTNYKKNIIPEYLKNDYPDTMMIVIENEYWNLKTYADYFSIDLKFKGKIETLNIYFSSLKTFVDPSVSFTLNLDIEESTPLKKNKVKKNKEKKPQIENKSNVIFLKPNSK
ncbi:ClpXP protease specificity-enhancing factor SspB [Alphaproteobacteria bacterium]|nr:ClpXP protease specificity-enhancing factor SspB [Alphaproteobacteria bacterium]